MNDEGEGDEAEDDEDEDDEDEDDEDDAADDPRTAYTTARDKLWAPVASIQRH